MALDGILVRGLLHELNQTLTDARVSKIQQPEDTELLLTFRTRTGNRKLLLSANASLPLAYLTDEQKPAPATAPNFCMLLRKHIGAGRVVSVAQPGLERILDITFEHTDELNDLREKHLIIELMGKYSNILFTDGDGMILDAIRHVTPAMSSVRTVLPGRPYFIPDTQHKKDALTETAEGFLSGLSGQETLAEAIAKHYTGFSFPASQELLFAGGMDGGMRVSALDEAGRSRLAALFLEYRDALLRGDFSPVMAVLGDVPAAFSAMPLPSYEAQGELYEIRPFPSVSLLLETFYRERNRSVNMKNRAQDLRKQAETLLERASRKADLYMKQLEDAGKRDRYRLYGELLNAYAYTLPAGVPSVRVQDYYSGEEIEIPTDPDLSAGANAKRYFDKYGKLKRTDEAVRAQLPETEAEIAHLSSIITSIDLSETPEDLQEIRKEMEESGYIKKAQSRKKEAKPRLKPRHYISSDGFHIYVGRNNLQNDWLTFRFAEGGDYFFHAKKAPGSHVILKTENREVPERAFEEAAAAAAYYSALQKDPKADVDYVRKKEVRKPSGAKPGFVIYYTNYSMTVRPGLSGLTDADLKGDRKP
ncbi:MAG: NFACT family protein [Lachnospiraceae bacterium]|nr:NFACT family protein [Lachnospiraceae bacterium]